MWHAGYIDGSFVSGAGDELVVQNPSDGSEVARLKGLSAAQFEQAVLAARTAFDEGSWSRRPMIERAEVLHRFLDAVEARRDEITDTLLAETGCPGGSGTFPA